jgi:diguanylate cyclase (GGDEF)-like protein
MYDTSVADELEQIMDEFGLDASALHLEVSESAYAEDPKQIIEIVGRLRAMGFVIEMDDFGMGHSSLNMLSSLPIDVLKLDLRLVRTAFSKDGERGMQMLGAVVDIARRLSVPIVVEGVETQEQLNTLRMLGCDAVQGFLLSEPVLAEAFEPLLVRCEVRQHLDDASEVTEQQAIAEEPEEVGTHESWWKRLPDVSLRSAEVVAVAASALVAVVLVFAMSVVWQGRKNVEQANERYILAQRAATDLEMGSDYLTENVRSFVMTGDLQYLHNYFEEIEVDQRRFQAVHDMEELLAGDKENEALESLSTALRYSNELVVLEGQAMKLRLLADGVRPADMPEQVRDVRLRPEQEGLSDEERQSTAEELVFGRVYAQYKDTIRKNADASAELLLKGSGELRASASEEMGTMLVVEYACTGVMFALVVADVLFMALWVRLPLGRMVKKMRSRELVAPAGVKELKIVSETYNAIFEDNRKQFDRLNYRSMHDALTGLFNRKAYELMSRELDLSRVALLMVDVDKFKTINDTYGHDVGDLVLVRVAEVLGYCFRSTDLVFRLGGDEFVVIMSNVDSSLSETVRRKIEQANVMLQKPTDDLPPTSLSVGVAFADRENPEGDIFKDADTALYRMKQSGRCGCVVF